MAKTVLAGIALVRPHKILLVHPTGYGEDSTWSIPKGHQEPREPTLQAARREVLEETGIDIPIASLLGIPKRVWQDRKTVMFYWIVNATWLPLPDIMPISQLQHIEVDEARFVDVLEAEELMETWQLPLLGHVPTGLPTKPLASAFDAKKLFDTKGR